MKLAGVNGEQLEISDDTVESFAGRIGGSVLDHNAPRYNEARLVWNGMIDKQPGLIVQCRSTQDVVEAVRFATGHELLVAVRGGGHNVAGSAVCNGGLVIDLSTLKGIDVDVAARRVRAAGGTTIGELDAATQEHGLAVPMGVVSETGIAGLTLGGGLGWMRRKHGLSSDNLISAEVVTASGEVLTASADSHPDLYWALQGGGGNFGVVTSFELQAHELGPDVYFSFLIHEGPDARAGLQFYRDWAAGAPEEISSFAILQHGPQMPEVPAEHQGKPVLIFLAMHTGTPEDGERALQPLREFGSPIADLSGAMPYLEVQQILDEDYPAREMRYYWKSRFLTGLDDDAIDRLIELNEAAPSHHSTLDIWQLGGALASKTAAESAFGDRSAPFLLGIEANWEEPEDDDQNLQWARRIYQTAGAFAADGQYLNFPGFYEEGNRSIEATFGDNLTRLSRVKQQYDPQNRFRLNPNIAPAPVAAAH